LFFCYIFLMRFLPDTALDRWLDHLDPHRLLHWLRQRRTRLLLAWAAALLTTVIASLLAWFNCRDSQRADGNWGHRNIDFSGQWLLAAMFVSGEGRHLYDRRYEEPLLEKAFPRDREAPGQEIHDPQQILDWMMQPDENSPLCGPLYPPVHALVFAPLGLLPPQPAYRLMQGLNLALTFLAAWLVERLTNGRIWMPVVLIVLFLYPGHAGGFHLGQNPQVSLALLLIGWLLLREGRDVSGGLVWGLLAFKPVWAVAFLLVPLLTRRWRFAASMMLSGAGLALATLPFTGLQPWFDWLQIGGIASQRYAEIRNWIFLSRDLISIPRRWLLAYDGHWVSGSPYGPLPTVLGVLLWVTEPLLTALVAWRKRREPAPLEGPGAAFVLLGAFFSCYHFMYYDVLLTVLPVSLLFTRPRCYLEQMKAHPWLPPLPLVVLVVLLLAPALGAWYDRSGLFPPFDTFALLVLWAWCGMQWCCRMLPRAAESQSCACHG
jgi:arabinofuranan 3-O-arabinosyltransferase